MDTSVKGKGTILFQVLCYVVLTILALMVILPFIILIASSFTDNEALRKYGYSFWPTIFSLYSYEYLFVTNAASIFRAYGITFFITIIGVILSLLLGPMMAYPLSRKDYPRAKIFTFYVFFTMLFNGGMVPSYMMWTKIFEIKNTVWALILPNLVLNGFFIILYKNNFTNNIHPALIEAAKIDGAGEFFIYRKIIVPLSLPIMATVGLMSGLGFWNDWVNGLYYITDKNLYSLQVLLNNIMVNITALASMGSVTTTMKLPGTSIRMAMAVIGVLPVLVLYPFFQRYFVKGIALGGVKE